MATEIQNRFGIAAQHALQSRCTYTYIPELDKIEPVRDLSLTFRAMGYTPPKTNDLVAIYGLNIMTHYSYEAWCRNDYYAGTDHPLLYQCANGAD